jgi:hypothetical protein
MQRDRCGGIAAAAHFACGDGGSEKTDGQTLKVYGGGGRLRRWAEASEALLARVDGAAGVQENRLC